jgi:riboflavin kinase/FMN adenylyltransferase
MHLIRGLNNIRSEHFGCVATIGNFDGLHLGHQKVLKNLIAQAKKLNLPSLVITFEPLPQEYFLSHKAPARLLRLREKLTLLKDFGVDRVLCLRFNKNLADIPAQEFVTEILVKKLGVQYLIVGDDFRFGKNRAGDFILLQQIGQIHNFAVSSTETFLLDNARVGSSRVRAALAQGDLKLAAQLLGRPYTMSGHVVYGQQLGRQLGFPTINITLPHLVIPLRGVFAVWVHGLGNKPLPGAANIGNRPAVSGNRDWLEVHLLDFNQDVYGRFVAVEFVEKLRDELPFPSLEELTEQIALDVAQTREILNNGALFF